MHGCRENVGLREEEGKEEKERGEGENWTFNPVGALGKYLPLDVFIVLITPGIAADLS